MNTTRESKYANEASYTSEGADDAADEDTTVETADMCGVRLARCPRRAGVAPLANRAVERGPGSYGRGTACHNRPVMQLVYEDARAVGRLTP
jgi:hypothetical protein